MTFQTLVFPSKKTFKETKIPDDILNINDKYNLFITNYKFNIRPVQV